MRMIFINDGVIQISPHPLQIAFDLTALFKAIYQKAEDDGASPDAADKLITFAIKLSRLPDNEIEEFLTSLPENQPITFDDILTLLDNWQSVPYVNAGNTGMYS